MRGGRERGRWREDKRGGSREEDQYMDSYGDSVTIGCRGKIAHYRLLDFFSLWE